MGHPALPCPALPCRPLCNLSTPSLMWYTALCYHKLRPKCQTKPPTKSYTLASRHSKSDPLERIESIHAADLHVRNGHLPHPPPPRPHLPASHPIISFPGSVPWLSNIPAPPAQ